MNWASREPGPCFLLGQARHRGQTELQRRAGAGQLWRGRTFAARGRGRGPAHVRPDVLSEALQEWSPEQPASSSTLILNPPAQTHPCLVLGHRPVTEARRAQLWAPFSPRAAGLWLLRQEGCRRWRGIGGGVKAQGVARPRHGGTAGSHGSVRFAFLVLALNCLFPAAFLA